ncbi:homoserine dehydrogenase [Oryzisolibacter propanilivorax]|uniref:Homoserine dehydrogenase n=1 Tax=Oryzisolibacter propanilivorax TaxID=1527607 RepID=A0A1G9QJ40_9BURK|nr:hypothetical protein [Oryzisolibacter propanilivorax]SDM10900.1 homoserine dehydrogenase [Oryzisolibacter propanilivorax]
MLAHAEPALTTAPQPSPLPSAWPVSGGHLLRLRSERALCEATVVRLLARWGLAVQRRRWLAGGAVGSTPELLLLTAAAPAELAAAAALQLQQATGALVQCQAAAEHLDFDAFSG